MVANTQPLKDEVEPYVRTELEKEYGIPFKSMVLELYPGGEHEFDAVSKDKKIIATIKTSSGSGAGKVHAVVAELYYLMLVDAPIKIVVLTDPEFYRHMDKKLKRALYPGLHLKLVELSPQLQALVAQIQKDASDEVSP